jgi:hypothetical protein
VVRKSIAASAASRICNKPLQPAAELSSADQSVVHTGEPTTSLEVGRKPGNRLTQQSGIGPLPSPLQSHAPKCRGAARVGGR